MHLHLLIWGKKGEKLEPVSDVWANIFLLERKTINYEIQKTTNWSCEYNKLYCVIKEIQTVWTWTILSLFEHHKSTNETNYTSERQKTGKGDFHWNSEFTYVMWNVTVKCCYISVISCNQNMQLHENEKYINTKINDFIIPDYCCPTKY